MTWNVKAFTILNSNRKILVLLPRKQGQEIRTSLTLYWIRAQRHLTQLLSRDKNEHHIHSFGQHLLGTYLVTERSKH